MSGKNFDPISASSMPPEAKKALREVREALGLDSTAYPTPAQQLEYLKMQTKQQGEAGLIPGQGALDIAKQTLESLRDR